MARAMARAALLAVLLLAVAGCAAPDPDAGTASASTVAPSESSGPAEPTESSVPETKRLDGEVRTDFHLDGCLDPRMLFVLDPDEAQALLPPGFTAADASDLVQFTGVLPSSPIPSGRAVGGYDFLACAGDSVSGGAAAFSQVGILVNAPDLGERTPVDDATFDLYLLAFHADQPAWSDWARASGFSAEEAPHATIVSEASEVVADQHRGAGHVAVGEAVADALYLLASGGNELDIRARYWHVGANGTAYLEFRLREEVRAGVIPTCTHAEGSAYAKVAGGTTCAQQGRFAAVGLDTTVDGTRYWIPGVFPA